MLVLKLRQVVLEEAMKNQIIEAKEIPDSPVKSKLNKRSRGKTHLCNGF